MFLMKLIKTFYIFVFIMLGFWLMLFTIKLYSRKDILKIDNLVFLDKVNLT